MKKGLGIAGVLVGAALIGVVVGLYRTDADVKDSIDKSVEEISNLANLLIDKVSSAAEQRKAEWNQQTRVNQQWADQQWDALGL
jgi:hypothetical protein